MNERYKTTILLTTHDITDIEALCERVIMLDEGNIMYDVLYIIFVRSGEQKGNTFSVCRTSFLSGFINGYAR